MGEFSGANDSADRLQGRPDQAIAGGVDGQFGEAASHPATVEELMPLRVQQVDAPPDSAKDSLPGPVPIAQIAPDAPLHLVGEDACDQVRNVFGILLDG